MLPATTGRELDSPLLGMKAPLFLVSACLEQRPGIIPFGGEGETGRRSMRHGGKDQVAHATELKETWKTWTRRCQDDLSQRLVEGVSYDVPFTLQLDQSKVE